MMTTSTLSNGWKLLEASRDPQQPYTIHIAESPPENFGKKIVLVSNDNFMWFQVLDPAKVDGYIDSIKAGFERLSPEHIDSLAHPDVERSLFEIAFAFTAARFDERVTRDAFKRSSDGQDYLRSATQMAWVGWKAKAATLERWYPFEVGMPKNKPILILLKAGPSYSVKLGRWDGASIA